MSVAERFRGPVWLHLLKLVDKSNVCQAVIQDNPLEKTSLNYGSYFGRATVLFVWHILGPTNPASRPVTSPRKGVVYAEDMDMFLPKPLAWSSFGFMIPSFPFFYFFHTHEYGGNVLWKATGRLKALCQMARPRG